MVRKENNDRYLYYGCRYRFNCIKTVVLKMEKKL